MEKTQWYIGSPNGIVACLDGLDGWRMDGRLYSRYSEHAVWFHNAEQLVELMESLFDELNFPHATTEGRSFGEEGSATMEKKERTAVMKDEELLKKHGELGTFVVRVQHRQNNSWQGRITWMEENKTLHFRSVWELIKLIESALNTRVDLSELEKEPGWFPEEEEK